MAETTCNFQVAMMSGSAQAGWWDEAMRQPQRVAAPLFPALLAFTALLPQGLNIRPGGILLTMPRLVLLAAIPVIVMRLIRPVPGSVFRFGPCDKIVLFAAFWMFIAVTMTQGIGRAAVGSSVMILEFCGSYFVMRTGLNRPGEAVAVARLLATVIAVDGLLSILDVLQNRPVLLDLADALTGFDQAWQEDYRHGMMRALGMQEHPIMLGTVSVFGVVISLVMMRGIRRAATFAGCMIGLVTSDSSAPILGFMILCTLMVYQSVMASFAGRWRLLLFGSLTLFVLFAIVHPNPFSFLIMHTASVPQDGFYRLLIWNLVGPLVMASPLFGLGLESDFAARFQVNNTIDCFWLASAVNFGIVGSALFGLTLLTSCGKTVALLPGGAATQDEIRLGRALGIIIFLYFFIGMTVHFWGTVWILLGLVAATRVHLGELSEADPNAGPSHFEVEHLNADESPDRAFAAPAPEGLAPSGGD